MHNSIRQNINDSYDNEKMEPNNYEEKKYPIGGYAPGNYHCTCGTCGSKFNGDKRAVQCEPCALKDKAKFAALSPEEQQELLRRNAALANEMFAGKQPHKFEDPHDQIIANQLAGMSLEQAIYQAGYTSGVEFQKRQVQGAVWVKTSEFKYELNTPYHAKDDTSKGAGRFDENGIFTWGDDSITLPENQNNLLILDESPAINLLDILDEARLQIEYLHRKYGETESGSNILSRMAGVIKG